MMQGMSFASLKKHTALIPLFVCVGLGCAGSMIYLARLAFRNPEVSWNKKGNQEPWQEYEKKQYKIQFLVGGSVMAYVVPSKSLEIRRKVDIFFKVQHPVD